MDYEIIYHKTIVTLLEKSDELFIPIRYTDYKDCEHDQDFYNIMGPYLEELHKKKMDTFSNERNSYSQNLLMKFCYAVNMGASTYLKFIENEDAVCSGHYLAQVKQQGLYTNVEIKLPGKKYTELNDFATSFYLQHIRNDILPQAIQNGFSDGLSDFPYDLLKIGYVFGCALISTLNYNGFIDIYTGFSIEEKKLWARGYYQYKKPDVVKYNPPYDFYYILDDDTNYKKENPFPSSIEFLKLIPNDCWLKKIPAGKDSIDKYYYIALEIEDSKIKTLKIILEQKLPSTNRLGLLSYCLPESCSYELVTELDKTIQKELDKLINNIPMPRKFDFVGSGLPASFIEKSKNSDGTCTFAMQSAYRRAYSHVTFYFNDNNNVDSIAYSTYLSTGSSYGDMFSRPQSIDDRASEIMDMMLYIFDMYNAEELDLELSYYNKRDDEGWSEEEDEYNEDIDESTETDEDSDDEDDEYEEYDEDDIEEYSDEELEESYDDDDSPQLKNPQAFMTDCHIEFLKVANGMGFAETGIIYVPELINLGSQTVLKVLQDSELLSKCGNDPDFYHMVVLSRCLQLGIVFGDKWHTNFSGLNEKFIEDAIYYDLIQKVGPLLSTTLRLSGERYKYLTESLYEKWLELQEPYWQLDDSRQYIFVSMLAAYAIGVSMILNKYGYR